MDLTAHRARTSAMARALNAQPEFKAMLSARQKARMADPANNPLAALTPEQRAFYEKLRRRNGYGREEALSAAQQMAAAK